MRDSVLMGVILSVALVSLMILKLPDKYLFEIYLLSKKNEVDAETMLLCKEYAERDHEKEIAPQRWMIFKDDFNKFDWYNSCINHVLEPFSITEQ